MKYVVRKAFWDYEKEEKWLNEMSAKGMALTDYSWCRYVFEETAPAQYTYRIDLLHNEPTNPESVAYIRFLEESGIECVSTYRLWVYLRKKASEGPFELYTDIDSRINHYKRIYAFWKSLMVIEFMGGSTNLLIGIINLSVNKPLGNFPYINIVIGVPLVALGFLFLFMGRPLRNKIKKLEQEKTIRE